MPLPSVKALWSVQLLKLTHSPTVAAKMDEQQYSYIEIRTNSLTVKHLIEHIAASFQCLQKDVLIAKNTGYFKAGPHLGRMVINLAEGPRYHRIGQRATRSDKLM